MVSLPQVLLCQITMINFDYFTVDESPKGPIGFLGTGVSMVHPNLPVYGGIRLNNALIGTRAGYYTFGYHMGAQVPLRRGLYFHPRLMFTSGGGAESNDGSGGFATISTSLDYKWKDWSLGMGGQYSYISTGVIQGVSPYITLNKSISFVEPLKEDLHVQLFTNTLYSIWNEHSRPTGFIGIGGRSFSDQFYTSVYLTAAVTDLGGYMDVYGGYGTYKDVGPFRLLLEANLGTGGGGRAPAGGGALWGTQGELQYHAENLFAGISGGLLSSINEPFYFSFLALHLGTELKFNSNAKRNESYATENLQIESSIRTYLGSNGFSNLGVAFQLYRYKALSLRGESYWAFTDGRGAYAEGLFGIRYQKNWWYIESQVGAGAGGGINLWNGAGLVFINSGFDIPLNERVTLNSKYIYNAYSTTEFPVHGLQFGLGYKIPFKKA